MCNFNIAKLLTSKHTGGATCEEEIPSFWLTRSPCLLINIYLCVFMPLNGMKCRLPFLGSDTEKKLVFIRFCLVTCENVENQVKQGYSCSTHALDWLPEEHKPSYCTRNVSSALTVDSKVIEQVCCSSLKVWISVFKCIYYSMTRALQGQFEVLIFMSGVEGCG